MDRYWENGSGYYDSVAKETIEKENKARNKEVHDTIQEIKNILKDRDLKLVKRIELQDKTNGRVYK
mgnify:CR=1 FL=1